MSYELQRQQKERRLLFEIEMNRRIEYLNTVERMRMFNLAYYHKFQSQGVSETSKFLNTTSDVCTTEKPDSYSHQDRAMFQNPVSACLGDSSVVSLNIAEDYNEDGRYI